MQIYDITLPIHPEMLHWGRRPEVEVVESIATGDASNVTRWRIGTHTGTHVDAPAHFVDGATPVDEIPLDTLVGPAVVLDLTSVEGNVHASDLEAAGAVGHRRLLLKTSNSAGPLKENERAPRWVGLAPDAAQWVLDHDVVLVGIDYMTIESPELIETWDAHHVLLPAGVIILENADLDAVPPGAYELVCLPAKLLGADGAFARTILVDRG